MRNIWKRAIAGMLALAMCLSFAGCYDENKTWAARQGDDTMPIGGYIYYLYSAYSEAMQKVDTETQVLKAEIDGEDATQWIKDRAMSYLQSYYYIGDKFDEYGLELTQEDQNTISSTTDSFWAYYQSMFEDELGIAKASFDQAYSQYNAKYQKVMKAMYDEGGELALADNELKDYFTENYYSYEYFFVSLTTTNDDGEKETLSADDQDALKKELQSYVDKINSGDMTLSEAAEEYAADHDADSTYYKPSAAKSDNITSELVTALDSVSEGKAAVASTSNALYVIRKLSIDDAYTDEVEASDSRYISLLADMKGDEFNDYVMEQSVSVSDVEINTAAINSVSLSSMVDDSNKFGTVSETEDETEDGDSSSTEESTSSESSTSEESSASESSAEE